MTVKAILLSENMPLFKEAVKLAKNVHDEEVQLFFKENEVLIGCMSRDTSVAIGAKMHSSFFHEYVCDEEKEFSINSKILDRATSRLKNMDIYFDGQLKFVSQNTKLVMPCVLAESDFKPEAVLSLSYENVLTVPNTLLNEVVKDMGIDNISSSQEMTVSLEDFKLNFTRKTSYIDSEQTLVVENDGSGSINTHFDEFQKVISGLANKAEEVRLDLETDKPLVVKYTFPVGMQLAFALAPRSPDEEEFYDPEAVTDEWDDDEEEDEAAETDGQPFEEN